jgi:FAD/FMN-containing dehydrogenase
MPDQAPAPAHQDSLIERLAAIVGDKAVIRAPAEMAPYLTETRGLYQGQARCVVRPQTTEDVAAVVRLCASAGVPIVPQGGNTGLVGGGVPFGGGEVVVSLARMNRVRAVDPVNDTITVEAGCILQQVQEAAEREDRLFPLSLGAEGTCQIGGNLSTNAGGIQVLRYGNMRALVLGLEVVLPDGRIWNGLRGLRKDNTGFDLKQLFIGGEGTLGIITAAVLRLFPRPKEKVTAFVAVRDVEAAVALLGRVRGATGEAVTSFELIPRFSLEIAAKHVAGVSDPLGETHPWYVLVELWSESANSGLREAFEEVLAQVYEDDLVQDATFAANESQSLELWRIREAMVEAQKFEGGSIKHDIAVPISAVASFITRACKVVEDMIPGSRPVPFGHIGDGNIHFNISQPVGADTQGFLARWSEVNRAVHDIVVALNGSISAEHGIGRLKIDENVHYKQPIEIELMQRIKHALDPNNLMNPGKVVPPAK